MEPKDLQTAVNLISGILVLFGTSGLGGMVLIFYRLGQSRQQTLSTLKSIERRLVPLENWRERRGDYMTRTQCNDFHDGKQEGINARFEAIEDDVSTLQSDIKELVKTGTDTKLLVTECLAGIRVRNEVKQ